MHISVRLMVKRIAITSFLLMCSSGLFAEIDNSAEMDSMASYLAAGMACATATENYSDQDVHEKILGLVTNLTNKTYFYTEAERELIQEKALMLSAKIFDQPDIENKCVTLSSSL